MYQLNQIATGKTTVKKREAVYQFSFATIELILFRIFSLC